MACDPKALYHPFPLSHLHLCSWEGLWKKSQARRNGCLAMIVAGSGSSRNPKKADSMVGTGNTGTARQSLSDPHPATNIHAKGREAGPPRPINFQDKCLQGWGAAQLQRVCFACMRLWAPSHTRGKDKEKAKVWGIFHGGLCFSCTSECALILQAMR